MDAASLTFNLLQLRQQIVIRRQLHHQPVLQIQQHLPRLPVIPDQRVQRVRARDPPHNSAVVTQRSHRVPLNAQIVSVRSPVLRKQSVHESKQLHDPLILPQVLVSLQQVHVVPAVVPPQRDFPRPLLARDDDNVGRELRKNCVG